MLIFQFCACCTVNYFRTYFHYSFYIITKDILILLLTLFLNKYTNKKQCNKNIK